MFIYKCKIETHLTQWFTLFYSVPVLSSSRHLYTNRCSQTGPPPVTDEPILHLLVILSPIGKDIPSTLSKPQFCVVGKLDIGEHAENAEVCGDAWFTGVWGSSHSGLMLSVLLIKSSFCSPVDPWGTNQGFFQTPGYSERRESTQNVMTETVLVKQDKDSFRSVSLSFEDLSELSSKVICHQQSWSFTYKHSWLCIICGTQNIVNTIIK